jgi:hypothetical protein
MVREMFSLALLSGLSALVGSGRPADPACGPAIGPAGQVGAPAPRTDSSMLALYASGRTFPEFMDASTRRLPEWYRSAERVVVADSSLARARAVGGQWRLLVVAVDTCGDSLRQVPYVARLAELVHGLSMRIVTPGAGGAAVQDAYRSLDGRRATPTYVLLDEAGRVQGCIVELPRPLRHWLHERRGQGSRESSRALADSAVAWYAADAGASLVHEVAVMLEQAKAGTPQCERGAASGSATGG